jgi:Flp pilus assembly protein TadG
MKTIRQSSSSGCARRRFLRGQGGDSLVEMALFLSFIGAPLLIGTGEMGTVVYDSIEVTNSANAGAQYGMQSDTLAADTQGIVSAAQQESQDLGTSLSVTPTIFYACSASISGTRYTGSNAKSKAAAGCTGSSNHEIEFIQVQTALTVIPPLQCPGLPRSFSLSGIAIQEVQQ